MAKEAAPPIGLMTESSPRPETRTSLRRSTHLPPGRDDTYRGRGRGNRNFAYLELHKYDKSPHDVAPKANFFAYVAESNIDIMGLIGTHEAFTEHQFPGRRPEEVVGMLEAALNKVGILYKTHGLLEKTEVHLISIYNTTKNVLESIVIE